MSTRRNFLQSAAATMAATVALRPSFADHHANHSAKRFKISLAEWSLHRTLRDKSQNVTNLDFPRLAKEEFGIDGIEYVNQFFMDKANDQSYLKDLKKRCEDLGVTSLLIMVDREGALGDADATKRTQAIENHYKWVDAAKFLGCHSIRVNAKSSGSYADQISLAADGLGRLSTYAADQGLNVIVENHGGLSSNGAWLAAVMERVGMDNCGSLPDFGNFYIKRGDNPIEFNRYQGVQALMPYAKAVSAKFYDFDAEGNETTIDYERMMQIVTDAGYDGYVGIEWEGKSVGEFDGIRRSAELLRRLQATA